MPGWNFADVWETVAQQVPDAPAQVHGDRRISWGDFDRRANGVAQALLDAGLAEQDKVAQYLYNGPEYLESVFATFKAGLAPINTNYRYLDDELVYLLDNSDAEALLFHGALAERVAKVRDRAPKVQAWIQVDHTEVRAPFEFFVFGGEEQDSLRRAMLELNRAIQETHARHTRLDAAKGRRPHAGRPRAGPGGDRGRRMRRGRGHRAADAGPGGAQRRVRQPGAHLGQRMEQRQCVGARSRRRFLEGLEAARRAAQQKLNVSVYAVATIRTGRKTGPRSVRSRARASPTTTTSTAATASTRRLSHRPRAISGSTSHPYERSKKVALVRSQPGALVTVR